MKLKQFTILALFVYPVILFSQNNDKAVYKVLDKSKSYYFTNILHDVTNQNSEKKSQREIKYLSVDFSGKHYPVYQKEYSITSFHNPVSQGNTGTCWCYSATSFMESEAKRKSGYDIKLSEMWTVYWEYVERAKQFVETKGNTTFSQGSEANEVQIIYKKYGAVRYKDFMGKNANQKFHNHSKLIKELKTYLNSVKEKAEWDIKKVEKDVKTILNLHLGTPPKDITIEGETITPKQFLNDILKLNMNEYFSFMSTSREKFNEQHELIEDDNWRHSKYFNVSLADFYGIILNSIQKGYTVSICGDVSEPGHNSIAEIGIIPSFDIPQEFINQDSRELRLQNKSTTDDHCIHIVGYKKHEEQDWFLIKDSGSGAFDGNSKGFRYFREDYIKLKMMNILVHRDVATEVLDKIIK